MVRHMNLPDVQGRDKLELIETLLHEEYGYLPKPPYSVTGEIISADSKFCAGKAELKKISLSCIAEWGEYTFPVFYVCPKRAEKVPCFLHINFRDQIPDRYQPTEELVDHGYATLTFCYNDVTKDNADFTDGLAGVVYADGQRGAHDCGKIGLWAYAAMTVMDYAMTLPELDCKRISVVGHSRLGKTALLAGALDERFFCAFSNDSGCSGAAISRQKEGESVSKIVEVFPYWFNDHYKSYAGREEEMPFDQHWLIAANYPHKVYVASAAEDRWACPVNEYLSCVAASEYYRERGGSGFAHPNRFPMLGECFHDGDIGYHLRGGMHYLSREDWIHYIEFLRAADKVEP